MAGRTLGTFQQAELTLRDQLDTQGLGMGASLGLTVPSWSLSLGVGVWEGAAGQQAGMPG